MSTSSNVDAPALETRRSRREAALREAALREAALRAPRAATLPSAPAAGLDVPGLEPDLPTDRPVAVAPRAAAPVAVAPRAAAAPVAAVRHVPAQQPDAPGAASATSWSPDLAPATPAPARPAAVAPARPAPATPAVVAPAKPAAVAPATPAPARPAAVAPARPAPAPAAVAPVAQDRVPTAARTRRESVAAQRRGAGRGADRPAARRVSTRTARAGVLATLVLATVAVPLAQGAAGGVDEAVARDYASGRATVDVLMSPRGLSDRSVIVADTLAGRGIGTVSRSEVRVGPDGCDPNVVVPTSSNGRLSNDQLCDLPQKGHRLQPAAAVAFTELNAQFVARFGSPICLSDSYRSLSGQYSVAATRGAYAARPGTSQHGLGLALDLCSSTYRNSTQWSWLKANGPVYGFDNPTWARRGGGGMYEPWHWEYFLLVDY